uniref:Uncharacterized protein n=1 Tax=Oryza glumipatula TaxID=40148 RepID=A0A0E0BFM2_9ORYZ
MPRGCEKASRLSLSLTCGSGTGRNCLAVAATLLACQLLRERVGPTGSRWVDTGAEDERMEYSETFPFGQRERDTGGPGPQFICNATAVSSSDEITSMQTQAIN